MKSSNYLPPVDQELPYDDPDMMFEEESVRKDYDETSNSNNNKISYKVIEAKPYDPSKEPFSNVCGLDYQKNELLNVVNWFKNSKELKKRNLSIPKGVILFGEPGNGKTLLMKEIIDIVEAPVFLFEGNCSDIPGSINEVFVKARERGHAVVIIDELDLLINKDRLTARTLQENLDGVESTDDILVICATNSIYEIPDALQRHGRLDKIMHIPKPRSNISSTLLEKYFKEYNVELPDDYDAEGMGLFLYGLSCSGIKAVVNDCLLRNGFENITTEMIEESICRIEEKFYRGKAQLEYNVSVHEAGHAIMAMSYPQYFKVGRINLRESGGITSAEQVNDKDLTFDKNIADIEIGMAGFVAEKLVCGKCSEGSEEDLNKVRCIAEHLVNESGYSSLSITLPEVNPYQRRESQLKLRNNEKIIESLLRKCERRVYRYLKKHVNEIKAIADALHVKKRLKTSEILEIVNSKLKNIEFSYIRAHIN